MDIEFNAQPYDIVRALEKLYVSSRERYVMYDLADDRGRMFVPKDDTGKPRQLTTQAIFSHIYQRSGVCVFAGWHSTSFMCFDVDEGGREAVLCVVSCLVGLGFSRDRIYISSSGGKGYHVEIFFEELVYVNAAHRIYAEVIARTGLNPRKVEFRPTHGQAIKLPLSIHRQTHNMCWFCDQLTLEPIPSYSYIFGIKQVPRDEVNRIAAGCHAAAATPRGDYDKSFEIGPRTEDLSLSKQGERHKKMVRLAVNLRYEGKTADECTRALIDWYLAQPQDLINSSEDEVYRDIKLITDWAYGRKFNVLPPEAKNVPLTFSPIDVNIIMAQPTKTKRKLMFMIMRGQKRFGAMCCGQGELAKICGITSVAISRALKSMVDEGWISVSQPKAKITQAGLFVAQANRYRVSKDAAAKAAQEVHIDPLTVYCSEDPVKEYSILLRAAYSADALRERLTAKEFKEVMNYGNSDSTKEDSPDRRELCA